MANVQEIKNKIKAKITDAEVTVLDPMNDGNHLEAIVIAPSFAGKNMVAQHRMVYAALGDAFSTNLHALKLTTKTPE